MAHRYEEDRPSKWLLICSVVVVGGLTGLLYIGPSSWTWRGLLAPAAAGVAYAGSFMALGLIGKRAFVSLDGRVAWVARTALGIVAGAIAGAMWFAVTPGDGLLVPCLLGAGMGGFAALMEA